MAILATTKPGSIYIRRDGASTAIPQQQPVNIEAKALKPCMIPWERRLFMIGQFSRGLIRCENRKSFGIGMSAPGPAPVIANGTSTGGAVGQGIPYTNFKHKINGNLVHQSNPSVAGTALAMTGVGRVWTNLPTSDPEARATHVGLWLKLDDALAREVCDVPIGVATVTENVPALSWGAAISFRRGVPPYTMFAIKYHNRMFYGGDPAHDFYLWYSELGEPESVASDNFIPTKSRDAITGLGSGNEDQLGCLTRKRFYDVQGFRGADFGVNADFTMRQTDPSIGCISHHSIVSIHDRLWWMAEKGHAVYDGAPRYVSMKSLQKFYYDLYLSDPAAFEKSWAVDDDTKYVLKSCVNMASNPKSFYFIANYRDVDPKVGTPQLENPRYAFDVRTRQDSAGAMIAAEGTKLTKLITGSCDGQLYEENVESNGTDAGDAYDKKMVVQVGHSFFEAMGGDRWKGKQYPALGLFLKNEDQAATLKLYPGNESAPPDGVVNPSPPTIRGTCTIPAGAVVGKVARMDYFLRPYLTGEGLSFRLEVLHPVGVEYAGWYGEWMEGLVSRGPSS
jgi:hypothetical protein